MLEGIVQPENSGPGPREHLFLKYYILVKSVSLRVSGDLKWYSGTKDYVLYEYNADFTD